MRRTLLSIAVVIVAVAVYGVLVLTGKVESPFKGGVSNTLSSAGAKSGSELYSELSSLISNPDSKTDLTGKFTFAVYVAEEAQEVEFDDEPGVKHQYQAAFISRSEKYFMLDVKDLDKPLEPDSYYSVTGKLNGSVYWTENNKKVSALDISATGAKPFVPDNDKVNTGPGYADGLVSYTFLGAHYTEVMVSRKAVVVYFDFKNESDDSTSPNLSRLGFYQGNSGERSSSSVMDPKQVDSRALNASKPGRSNNTYAGKTSRYCAVYFVPDDITEDKDTLRLVRYDDDFSLIDEIAIPIKKDLAAWEKS